MPLTLSHAALAAWIRLSRQAPPAAARAGLDALGAPEAIFARSYEQLVTCFKPQHARKLAAPVPSDVQADIERGLTWCAEPDQFILPLSSPHYPSALAALHDPPTVLYVAGCPEVLDRPGLAIVGARHASIHGAQNARAFAYSLASRGLNIVSGLAVGIDAAAHEGALAVEAGSTYTAARATDHASECSTERAAEYTTDRATECSTDRTTECSTEWAHEFAAERARECAAMPVYGRTIAVMGTGLLHCYPREHRDLARRIRRHGALVSELPLDWGPRASHFPRRNRIVAGLSRGVLVVEAAAGSGSLITARLANDAGRDVFALPGSIHSPLSRGCHALIREGAKLVETAQHILEEFPAGELMKASGILALHEHNGPAEDPAVVAAIVPAVVPSGVPSGVPSEPATRAGPDGRRTQLLLSMAADPVSLDSLSAHTGQGLDTLSADLLTLCLSGDVLRLPDGRYQVRQR